MTPTRCFLLCVVGLGIIPGTSALGRQLLDGDVYIQVVASIYRQDNQNGTCSDIDTESVANLEAVRWTLEKINAAYTAFRIGMHVIETCASAALTKQVAMDLSCEIKTHPEILGVIGVDSSSETEVLSRLLSSLPSRYQLPQISFSATSVLLRDRQIYQNLFRVIPSDDIQVQAMTKFLEELKWNYITVVYEDNEYGRGGVNALRSVIASKGHNLQLCIPVEIAVPPGSYETLFTELRDKVFRASPPQQGIIVFGISSLMYSILENTELLMNNTADAQRPVFLFSETGSILDGTSVKGLKGAFIMSPHRESVSEYETWFVQKLYDLQTAQSSDYNLWLREMYASITDTPLGVSSQVLSVEELTGIVKSSVYSQYAIQATMVLVRAYSIRRDELCGTQGSACSELVNDSKHHLVEILNNISVNFDRDFRFFPIKEFIDPDLIVSFNNTLEVITPSDQTQYEVYNVQVCQEDTSLSCLKQVGDYTPSGVLNLDIDEIRDYDEQDVPLIWPNIRKAQCPVGYVCDACLGSKTADLFIEGDMYVVGIVPVHNQGDTPLQCGKIKLGGLDVLESIRFTVADLKRSTPGSIPKGSIGVILIDSCNDPQVVQEKVLTLNRLGVVVDGSYIPVREKIIGYIGGWSSDNTKGIAEITTRLKYPQISYASTATFLSRRSLYPYFLRVTSNDRVQAETMVNIVQRNFGANMFQVVYSESAYGEGGRSELKRLADENKLCVVNEIAITRQSNVNKIVQSLRKFSDAKIVVVFCGSFDLEYIVQEMNSLLVRNEFLFITSDGWGTRFYAAGLDKFIGSITLSVRLEINDKFVAYLRGLSPETDAHNLWLTEYMENHFNCYYEWSYNKTARQQCTGNERLGQENDYVIDDWAPLAERATTALLYSAKDAIGISCTSGTVCTELRDDVQQFVDTLTKLELTSDNRFPERVFDDNGDGIEGFQPFILNEKFQYILLESGDFLTQFRQQGGVVFNSTCSGQGYCTQCFTPPPLKSEEDTLPGGIIALIVILAVVCCILIAILLFVCSRHGCCIKIENGRPKLANPYLTAVSNDDALRRKDADSPNYLHAVASRPDKGGDLPATGTFDSVGMSTGSDSKEPVPSPYDNRQLPNTPRVQMSPGAVAYNADGRYTTAPQGNQDPPPVGHGNTDSGVSGDSRTESAGSSRSSGYIVATS